MAIEIQHTDSRTVLGDGFTFADDKEGWKIFDDAARLYLGMSGEDFLEKYRAGDLPTDADDPDVSLVEMLIPFTRQ